jgi:hypothetical protein
MNSKPVSMAITTGKELMIPISENAMVFKATTIKAVKTLEVSTLPIEGMTLLMGSTIQLVKAKTIGAKGFPDRVDKGM